jgi:hypothetical protein
MAAEEVVDLSCESGWGLQLSMLDQLFFVHPLLDLRQRCAFPNQGQRTQLQLIQFFDHFLHSADHERKPIVIELVGCVAG